MGTMDIVVLNGMCVHSSDVSDDTVFWCQLKIYKRKI
jgi:hypothetical protein